MFWRSTHSTQGGITGLWESIIADRPDPVIARTVHINDDRPYLVPCRRFPVLAVLDSTHFEAFV